MTAWASRSAVHSGATTCRSIESGGRVRRYVSYVPRADDGRSALPLVVLLHGTTSDPEQQLELSEFRPLADAGPFAVVAPEGLGHAWNVPADPRGPDDVAFVRDVIDDAQVAFALDARRVFVAGFSAGGRLASELACALPERIAAIAAVGGIRPPRRCSTQHAPAVLALHGTADPVNPYDGGGPAYWQTSVEDAIEAWRAHDGCEPARRDHVSPSVERRTFRCSGVDMVVLYRISGMGHQWPGSSMDLGAPFGPPTHEICASQIIWDFFRRRMSDAAA